MAEDLPRPDPGELSRTAVPQATSAFGPAAALDPEPTLGFALTHVPGYLPGRPDVAITRLAGGSVNHSYRVSTPAGEYVLRLSPQTDAWLVTDRKVERELHARAAAEGIAPRIVHADEQDRWLITEFIEGRLWSAADFAAADSLALLAQTLRRLHGLQAPARGRFDLLSALGAYVQRIRPADARLQTYLEEAARAWPASGAPDRRATIVHHDLHASNVIETRCGLMLIDWECAAVSDPLLDVACVLSYYEPARSFASMFLERVGLPGVSAPQLQAAVWLFDLHTWLWYCERRQRRVPTQAELDTARGLSLRVARGPQRGR